MDLSYWEKKEWFNNIDPLIIGSGIVGLCSAIEILKKNPNQNLLILEKGFLPQGASTKNAGFACFGSPTEILDDLKNLNEKEVISLIKSRWDGLKLLRKNIGDKNIGYKCHGGYELFFDDQKIITNSGFGINISHNARLLSRFTSSQSALCLNDTSIV